MTISFSGLGSGLDYSSWIDQLVKIKETSVTKVQSKNSELQKKIDGIDKMKSAYKSLNSAVETLMDSRLLSDNIFTNVKTNVSDSSYLSASAESGTAVQSLSVGISQLATATVLESDLSGLASDFVLPNFSSGNVKFTIGNSREISVSLDENDTVDDIISKFTTAAEDAGVEGFEMAVNGGKLNISANQRILFSSSSTSDFISKLKLTGNEGRTSYSSEISLECDASLMSAYGVTAGTFKLGGAEFTIDNDTTLNSLIEEINSSEEAGVTASFNQSTGNLQFVAKTTGELYISIGNEEGGSNFTDVFGLTTNGSVDLSKQNIGNNAKFTINGNEMEYYSNEIPDALSGVSGLTLTLNKVTDEDDITVDVEQDTEDLSDAMAAFVDAYNKIVTQTAELTKVTYTTQDGETTTTKAALAFDSQLTSMMSSLKAAMTSAFGDSDINSLSQIGITTKAAGATLTDNTNTIEFNKEAFLEAFSEKADEIKQFLVGDVDSGSKGILGTISTQLESNLDFENGYFAVRTESYNSQITSNNEKITRLKSSISAYRTSLEKKFSAMDSAISSLNSQYSYLTSALSSLFSNNSSSS